GTDGCVATDAEGPAVGKAVTVADPADGARAAVAASTSAFVIRPPSPDPTTLVRSTPRSLASRRTIGDKICDRGPRSTNGVYAPAPAGAGAARGGVRGATTVE